MYTLHIGDEVLAYWRQTLKREQSIFCLNNITASKQTVSLSNLNLIITDDWLDLISGQHLVPNQTELELEPYQSAWITNKF